MRSVRATWICLVTGAVLLPASALASSEIRSVTADGYGNAVIRTTGGAKIIAVGQADLAADFVAPDAVAAAENCREVGIIFKGRSYMYGVSDGDPVPQATRVICD